MRLGGPVPGRYGDPEGWVKEVKALGYNAAYSPVGADAGDKTIREYAAAAEEADIVIAETGAWSNPLSPDAKEAGEAFRKCCAQLELAEKIGARCCVNIAGSRGVKWDGPDEKNLTEETSGLIVESVQKIIDEVGPTRTYYTLETMPWMYPDSVESYVELTRAIDRKHFGVHFDLANIISSPQRYYGNAGVIREAVKRLGGLMRSCHGKDIAMREQFTAHLDEVRPGLGGLDYVTLLKELDTLDPDLPLMLEHLPNQEEYGLAAEYVRGKAAEAGVALPGKP
ncbi:MAG: sugar phosphate isomerase/epimerase [Planctomycetes bacterium]|nr:sugar phosphate isomerase/epimerase [Planctomycetota bacterium]